MRKQYTLLKFAGALALALGIFGCKGGGDDRGNDPFSEISPYGSTLAQDIENYHQSVQSNTDTSNVGHPALYIDFSAGMNTAFSNPEIKTLLGDCFNTILTDKFEVYQLVNGAVTPLAVTNPTELGQKVNDPKEYLNRRAPIQMGVEKIVASNAEALLITDFEEFQNDQEITSTAYLKIPFSKWLNKGNSIHFYVANYNEGKVTKHIYFTLFSRGTTTSQSLLSKLQPKLAVLKTKFDLSTRTCQLTTDYPTERSGGVFYDIKGSSEQTKNVLDLKSNYLNGLKKGFNYEFYPFGVDWKTIAELHSSYKEQNQFNDFFRKLFVDLSNDNSYIYEDFDVKVMDISSDFTQFFKCQEVKKHKPKLAKGSNGENKFADGETDPIALACYHEDGTLKSEWIFKPQDATPQPEVFTLNQTLFKNTKSSDNKRVEFGVSFDPQFKLSNVQNPDGLLRVDITIKKVKANLNHPILEHFKWTNSSGASNTALRESIVSTLQDLKPENKAVYSYYIKTNQ